MRKLLLLLFVVGSFFTTSAQSDITTFVLVRHAEKVDDGTKDPELKPEGIERAVRLSALFKEQKVNVVLSTPLKRTSNTVTPLATAHGLTVETYESLKLPQLEDLAAKHKGGTVIIGGHSNTIPALANLLTGDTRFKQFDDSDYGNIIIISVVTVGKNTNVTHLRY